MPCIAWEEVYRKASPGTFSPFTTPIVVDLKAFEVIKVEQTICRSDVAPSIHQLNARKVE